MTAKQKAMAAARRMGKTTNKARTVKTWARHMKAVLAEAAIIGGKPE